MYLTAAISVRMSGAMGVLTAMQVDSAVVETGSLVGASACAVAQHLGARLLNETTRRLSMTNVGGEFLAHARTILADAMLKR